MYLLDTNIYRLVSDNDPLVRARLVAAGPESVWLCSINVEEVLTGYMATIVRLRSQPSSRNATSFTIGRAHETLLLALEALQQFQMLPYTDEAEKLFQSSPAKVKRLGAQDCRIAALAMTRDMIVVTRNVRDFAEIGAPCEDWSRPQGGSTV